MQNKSPEIRNGPKTSSRGHCWALVPKLLRPFNSREHVSRPFRPKVTFWGTSMCMHHPQPRSRHRADNAIIDTAYVLCFLSGRNQDNGGAETVSGSLQRYRIYLYQYLPAPHDQRRDTWFRSLLFGTVFFTLENKRAAHALAGCREHDDCDAMRRHIAVGRCERLWVQYPCRCDKHVKTSGGQWVREDREERTVFDCRECE